MSDTAAPGTDDRRMAPGVARALWRVAEPFHQVCYASDEATAALEAVGLDRWDLRYFGARAAALGPVGPDVVAAAFYGFDPEVVGRAVPACWARATPATILEARRRGAVAALRRVLGDTAAERWVAEAAGLARRAVGALDVAGRPLAAAHAALEWPADPLGVLWQACTVLREHRGDGHVTALVAAGLGPVECHVLHGADGAMPATMLQRTSGWDDEAWAAAAARLTERGLLLDDGTISSAGRSASAAVEHRTDRLAMAPWRVLGPERTERLRDLLARAVPRIIASGTVNAWRVREELWRDLPDERARPRAQVREGAAADPDPPPPLRVAVVTKGHPFDREPFFALWNALDGIEWSHAEHPAAQGLFHPSAAEGIDAFVLYDMPGIRFERGVGPRYVQAPERFVAGFHRLLDAGKGFVFLHHAIAGWPAWHEYREIVGGQFLYSPAELRGRRYPDSGYRHDVTHTISVVEPTHPVCEGLPAEFEMTDEVYLCPVFERSVVPLLRSSHAYVDRNFYSAALAVQGRMFDNTGWAHPPGSNLVGWAKRYSGAPIVYLQPGDGVAAYTNPHYRRLVTNAIRWVASPAARAWAAEE